MRVTQSMLNSRMLQNLKTNNERMQKYQEMLASGKKINKPSDDPVGISFAMRYEAQLGRNEQYMRNLNSAKSLVEITDSVVSNINNIVQRVRELAVQGANDTVPLDAKVAIAAEVDQMYDEAVKLGNTRFNGKYIFNGQMTDIAPYSSANAENEESNDRNLVMAVADGVNLAVNATGQQLFGKKSADEADNLFGVLKQLSAELRNDNSATVSLLIGSIDSRLSKMQNTWAEIGARANRLDLIQNRLQDSELNLTRLQSNIEDANMAEVIMNFKMQENVQRASLEAGSRVIQPTLVDFLR